MGPKPWCRACQRSTSRWMAVTSTASATAPNRRWQFIPAEFEHVELRADLEVACHMGQECGEFEAKIGFE
jgi:hypothetical protein